MVRLDTGAWNPLNIRPRPDGNIVRRGQTYHVLSADETVPPGVPRYVSHFSTCPDASGWRTRTTPAASVSTTPVEEATEPTPVTDANICGRCETAMDPALADLEGWRHHPACDPSAPRSTDAGSVPPLLTRGRYRLNPTPHWRDRNWYSRRRTP